MEVEEHNADTGFHMGVYLCLGQPVFGSQEAITNANDGDLRLFSVGKLASILPENQMGLNSGWQVSNPETVKDFSAVAYFFGKRLHDILEVPVGLVQSSWGGSLIEAWMSKESLSPVKEMDLKDVDLKRGNRFPSVLFNAMINPLIPYTIKGAIWYQGEANISQPGQYKLLFPAMVKDWRARWGIGDFPFYYVQIAPYRYSSQNRLDDANNAAVLREVQSQCLDIIPNSGMAVTMDIGAEQMIHPPDKRNVADRLLYNALNNTYGYKAVNFSGPTLDSVNIRDKGIYLTFQHAEKGLYANGKLEGFDIAGADKVFYPADASILHSTQVLVKSSKVSNPVAVRYAFRSWVSGTLFNTFFLPASSFRTDSWIDAKQADQ
jgi:sialate O-acetylesterase